MQRITDKLHLHRKNRAPAPAPALAQDTLVKPGVTLNAQGQPITQPIAPLPGSIPLASQPSTLGKHPHGDVPATGLTQAPILQQPTLQQPILQQSTLQQTQRTLVQPPLQQPIMQQSTLQQTALPQQQWQQSNLQQGFPLQKQGFQQQGWQQGMQQGMQQNVQTITRPAVVESIVRPAMIEQTARIEKVVEVQPVIHRNIDAPEVHIIEQHSYETAALAGPHMITNPTIVEEVVKPRVIEEVVPVIHREVPAPVIERVEQHIQERVAQPTVTNKVIQQQGSVIVQGQARALPTQQIASQPTVMHSTAATLTETVTVPTVVEQTVVPQKITEVQPVIHRTIDAPEVHVIEKHMYEQVRSTGPSVLYRQPLVEETVTPRIIEDIQPVVHREVPQVVVERQEQHITENLTQAAVTTKQVIEDRVTKPLPPIPSQTRAMAQPTAAPTVHSVTAAATVENRTMPAIIEQTARREVIQEIQPIIHREIDAPEVRVIEQHSYETVASTGPSTVTLAPVVQETVHPKIIEEIHPVLHRTVPQPFVERVEQHTTETISQPVVTTKQVFNTPVQTTTLPLQQQQQTFATAPLAGGLQQASGIPVPPPLPSKGFHSSQRGLQQQQGWSNNWNNNQQQGWNNMNNQQQGWNNNQQQQGWNNNLSQQPGWNDNLNNQPQGWNNRQQQGWNNNQQQGWNNNQQQGWNNQQQQQGWNNNLGGQQFASNIPTPPPLPSKQLTTGAFNNNLLGSKLQQNNLNNTFASPMMRGNQNQMPLQSNNLQGNLQRNIQNTLQNTLQGNQSNIPVPPPLPSSTTSQFAEKAPLQRNAMGSFQQAGGHAHFI